MINDIFIPERFTFGALDRDRVQVLITDKSKNEGRVVKILQRYYKTLKGSIFSSGVRNKYFYFIAQNKNINQEFFILPKDLNNATEGDMVLAEIIVYPDERRPAAVKVIKVLNVAENAKEDIENIIDEYNLSRMFPAQVSEIAKKISSEISQSDFKDRIDLRGLTTVTIDGETAKDFDDAISIERQDSYFVLYVHIADVSYYVAYDSPIDIEARQRATSIYFPDRVIPMLPKRLLEDICSLIPHKDRLAFTVKMIFDNSGQMVDVNFFKSVINSNARLTYTLVKEILIDKDIQERFQYQYLLNDLELMAELTHLLKDKRSQRGSLDFDLPEPEVVLDMQGRPDNILKAERNFAHMIIEEFMIATNETVARFIDDADIPMIYRVHEEPDSKKIDELMKFIRLMGIYKGKNPPSNLKQIIADVADTPYADVINYLMLRSLKQAKYFTSNIGHYGLASDAYCHFTSPIRRYPDLIVHRILYSIISNTLSDNMIKTLQRILPDISAHSSARERLASDVESASLSAYRCWFMKDRLGDEFSAKIIGLSQYAMKVRLNDFYVDSSVHVSAMPDDYYIFDESTMQMYGRKTKRVFKIADIVTVRVDMIDMQNREIILGLVC